MFLTCSVPSHWLSLCSLCKNNSTTWCYLCSNIGSSALKSKSKKFLLLVPAAWIMPSSSRKDGICKIVLLFEFFSAFRDFSSSRNCSNLKILLLLFLFLQRWLRVLLVYVWSVFSVRMLLYPLFTSLFSHINCSYRINAFFSPASIIRLMRLYIILIWGRDWTYIPWPFRFLVALTRPAQWATHFFWVPQCWLLLCQCLLECWYRSSVATVKHQLYPVSHLLDLSQNIVFHNDFHYKLSPSIHGALLLYQHPLLSLNVVQLKARCTSRVVTCKKNWAYNPIGLFQLLVDTLHTRQLSSATFHCISST